MERDIDRFNFNVGNFKRIGSTKKFPCNQISVHETHCAKIEEPGKEIDHKDKKCKWKRSIRIVVKKGLSSKPWYPLRHNVSQITKSTVLLYSITELSLKGLKRDFSFSKF